MKLQLPSEVSSLQEVGALESELRDYATWFAHNEVKAKVNAKSSTPPPKLSDAALQLLRTWNDTKLMTASGIEQLIHELADFKRTAETMTITLAAPAGKELRHALVGWCRQNLSPTILVSFEFNSSLLGGMVVRRGSRVFDWSFRRQIMNGRHTFPEVLRRV